MGWDPPPTNVCINHSITGSDVCKLSLTCSNTANSLLIVFVQFESFPRTYELPVINYRNQNITHWTFIFTKFRHSLNTTIKGVSHSLQQGSNQPHLLIDTAGLSWERSAQWLERGGKPNYPATWWSNPDSSEPVTDETVVLKCALTEGLNPEYRDAAVLCNVQRSTAPARFHGMKLLLCIR
jgi:hypothetical protein